jgi:LCP family protein required for cell wall assembly
VETQLHAEPPRRRWWILRVILGAFAIVLVAGGATAAIAFNEVGKVVEALGQSDVVKIAPRLLAPSSKGAPETLLLVGNDERPPPRDNPYGQVLPHSNEMLLVRIDPSKPTISMLSIPRELQVTFTAPDGEVITNRINSAYTYGGAQLMLETIKNVFGITVNHVFITSFPKFKRAVDELGCVYMGVDRRYYHVNEPGGEQYFEINLQPGYQRLCGKQALEFVANRHEDTSLTRDARDQRFLLEVKAQYGGSLFENREKFERILGKTVETDDTLHGQEGVLDLLELLVESEGKPVRQVPFNVTLLSTYDVASEQQIHESVRSFLEGTAAIHKPTLISATRATAHSHHASPARVQLTPTTPAELEQARAQAPDLPFALEYPRARDSLAAAEPDTLRVYDIHDQQGHVHPIYVVVIDRGEVGQSYDVQGTNWTDPPLLNDPGQTIHVGPRTYELFYAGEQVRVIAWHEAGAVYWIENTLTNNVSPRAMLAIAEQTLPVIAPSRRPMPPAIRSAARNIDLAPRAVSSTSLLTAIGALLGFLGIGIVAVLSLFVLARGRELHLLREQVAHALALEARQRPLFAAAGIPLAEPSHARASHPRPAPARDPLEPAISRARGRSRARVLAAAAAALLAGALAGAIVLVRARPTPAAPTVPVAVFNATSTPGAAHRIAAELIARHIHVDGIGNIDTNLSPGTHVLYPTGSREQARRVARLLPGPRPTVGPIQSQVREAAPGRDEIVIVLD